MLVPFHAHYSVSRLTLADEFGPWILERHRIQREYISAYYRDTDIAQPEEDFEDRLKLYAL